MEDFLLLKTKKQTMSIESCLALKTLFDDWIHLSEPYFGWAFNN